VFLLNDCLPNVSEHIDLLLSKSNHILIKTSPLLDITNGLKELKFVKEIHVVALKNEVKELLFVVEKNYTNEITIITTNIKNTKTDKFLFSLSQTGIASYSLPKSFLYEPNAAILKSGAFNDVALNFKLQKLHKHSHLYTNDDLIEIPGRTFEIIDVIPFNKKELKKRFKKQQFNITTRNFPKTVAEIRKELILKDGGNEYLFFTTNIKDEKIVVQCVKKK